MVAVALSVKEAWSDAAVSTFFLWGTWVSHRRAKTAPMVFCAGATAICWVLTGLEAAGHVFSGW